MEVFADTALVEQRQAVCTTCDKKVMGVCSMCGCILAAKTRLAAATCPLNKWPGETSA